MIVFIKADGTPFEVVSSPVYQGSQLSGSLYLVAPYPATNAVTVNFTLPNGDLTEAYPLTPINVIEGVETEKLEGYSIWEWQANNKNITEYAGKVTAQLSVLYPDGQVQTTASVDFTVLRGSVPLPPTEPTENQWDELIRLYGQIAGQLTKPSIVGVTFPPDDIGTMIVEYSNGTFVTVNYPVSENEIVIEQKDYIRAIQYSTTSWELVFGTYYLTLTPQQVGQRNSRFLVSVESGVYDYGTGDGTKNGFVENNYVTQIFKATDGTVVVTATAPANGRILIASTAILAGGGGSDINLENGSGEGSLQQLWSIATGDNATALGKTIANNDNELTAGQFNDDTSDLQADALFAVGNGTSESNKSTAFRVLKDGRAQAKAPPTADIDVVRKKELDEKADVYYATSSIAVGSDLSGKTLKFDTTANWYATTSYNSMYIFSSGGYSIGSSFGVGSDIEFGLWTVTYDQFNVATYTLVVSFGGRDLMVSTTSWSMSEYTLPADFGTVTEIQTDCSAFVSLDSVKVDCEYNYNAIQNISGGGGGISAPGYYWSSTYNDSAIAMCAVNPYATPAPTTVCAYKTHSNGVRTAAGSMFCVGDTVGSAYWWVYSFESTVTDGVETHTATANGIIQNYDVSGYNV